MYKARRYAHFIVYGDNIYKEMFKLMAKPVSGGICFTDPRKNVAIKNILEECSAEAETILKEREADLIRLARKLVQVKEMTGDEVKAFLASDEEPPIAPGEAHFQGKKQPAPEPEIT